jgi:hypothetical protein
VLDTTNPGRQRQCLMTVTSEPFAMVGRAPIEVQANPGLLIQHCEMPLRHVSGGWVLTTAARAVGNVCVRPARTAQSPNAVPASMM